MTNSTPDIDHPHTPVADGPGLDDLRVKRTRQRLFVGLAATVAVLGAGYFAYGAVIASLAGFAVVQAALAGISSNILVNEAIAVNIMAGITGSAAGGLGLALGMLGQTYAAAAATAGISPELLHRVAAIACGGLDSLPHNGAVITMLGICRLTHREAYFDMFMVSVVGPLLALVVVLVVGTTFGSF